MARKKQDKKWSEDEKQSYEVVSEYMNVAALYDDEDTLDEDRLSIRFKLTVRNIFLAILAFLLGVMVLGIYQTQTFGITPDGDYRLVTREVRQNSLFIDERQEFANILFTMADEMELYVKSPDLTTLSKTRTQRELLYAEWSEAIDNYKNGLTYDGSRKLTEPTSNEMAYLDAILKQLLIGPEAAFAGEALSVRAILQFETQIQDSSPQRSSNGLLPETNDILRSINQERTSIRRILEGGA